MGSPAFFISRNCSPVSWNVAINFHIDGKLFWPTKQGEERFRACKVRRVTGRTALRYGSECEDCVNFIDKL
jgi:hypothetical protein